ncbi:S-layer family protein [Natranaerovirga pectinivora]|uniref:S-layer family protein n=1 Tax=Natranaerovirga pectinivora TaxID=682400 RepID=A0A4R3MGC9_9FIRM|nr:S-layer homology domain-containing protein [Natranaerovirga pectinivora]TCT12977.1 S-layer family protein [Natranaerovirga pectinivora]
MLKNKIISLALTSTIILGGSALAGDTQLREEMFIPISTTIESQYKDISTHWAHDYILNLELRGILNPITTTTSQTKFDPTTVVTISEIADMLDKVFDFTSDDIEFKENTILKFIFENSDSNEPITRIDLARAITESFPAKDITVFTTLMFPVYSDTENLKSGEIGALSFVFNANIMRGYPGDEFKPYNSITRAEVAAVLNRTLDVIAIATQDESSEINERDYDAVVDAHLRMTGAISEIVYDKDDILYKVLVSNMGDESQPYDQVYALITEDTVIFRENSLIMEDPSILLEEGTIVKINFADVPVEMIYPVRIPAEVIMVVSETTADIAGIRLPVMEEYNMLMTMARTLISEIEEESLKEEYLAKVQSIENTRDGYENKIVRLERLIKELNN